MRLFVAIEVPEGPRREAERRVREARRALPPARWVDLAQLHLTLLFLGASLEGIEAYLAGISSRGTINRRHFALVGVTGAAWQARAAVLTRRFGVEVIPYAAREGHPDFVSFVGAYFALQALLTHPRLFQQLWPSIQFLLLG